MQKRGQHSQIIFSWTTRPHLPNIVCFPSSYVFFLFFFLVMCVLFLDSCTHHFRLLRHPSLGIYLNNIRPIDLLLNMIDFDRGFCTATGTNRVIPHYILTCTHSHYISTYHFFYYAFVIFFYQSIVIHVSGVKRFSTLKSLFQGGGGMKKRDQHSQKKISWIRPLPALTYQTQCYQALYQDPR